MEKITMPRKWQELQQAVKNLPKRKFWKLTEAVMENLPPVFQKPENKEGWEGLLTEQDKAVLREVLGIVKYPAKGKKAVVKAVRSGNGKKRAGKKEITEKDIITLALSCVSIKSPLPILSHFLFQDGTVNSTDLEQGLSLSINSGFGRLNTTGPAKLIKDFCKAENEVRANEEGSKLYINDHQVITLPTSEFPIFPRPEKDSLYWETTLGKLADVMTKAARFAANSEESRAQLTGLYFGEGVVVSTDGRRMFKADMLDMPGYFNPITIPAIVSKTIGKIYRLFGDLAVKVYQGERETDPYTGCKRSSQVFFEWEGGFLFSRTLEGEYPDYSALIRPDSNYQITVNKAEFTEAIKQAMITAQGWSNTWTIVITGNKDNMNIYSSTADLGQTSIDIPVTDYHKTKVTVKQVEPKHDLAPGELSIYALWKIESALKLLSEEVKIAFNGKFMLDFCASLEGESITLKIKDSESSVVVEEKDFWGCLMPIQIKEEVYYEEKESEEELSEEEKEAEFNRTQEEVYSGNNA